MHFPSALLRRIDRIRARVSSASCSRRHSTDVFCAKNAQEYPVKSTRTAGGKPSHGRLLGKFRIVTGRLFEVLSEWSMRIQAFKDALGHPWACPFRQVRSVPLASLARLLFVRNNQVAVNLDSRAIIILLSAATLMVSTARKEPPVRGRQLLRTSYGCL